MLHHGQKIRPVSVRTFSGLDAVIDDPHEGVLLCCLRDQVRHTGFPKGILIQLSGKRPLCGQNSHGHSGELGFAGFRSGGEDAEEGDLCHSLEPGQEIMGGVAGHDDTVCTAGFQIPEGACHFRYWVRAVAEDGGGAVGNVGIAVDVHPDMIPVRFRLRQQSDLLKQVGGGQRAHAA